MTERVFFLLLFAGLFFQNGFLPFAYADGGDLDFEAYRWKIKESGKALAPGPNFFSSESVYQDEHGIHLRIMEEDGRWLCAEIFCQEKFGYGTYLFTVSSRWDLFDSQAVLGLFTYSHHPDYHHRELDIEVSAWGGEFNNLGQFTVQPHDNPANLRRFPLPGSGTITFSLSWSEERIVFRARGENDTVEWVYPGKPPPPGSEKVHINLWLYQGKAPEKEVEVIIEGFRFIPEGSRTESP